MKGTIRLLLAGMLMLPSVAALAQDDEDDLFDEETAGTSNDTADSQEPEPASTESRPSSSSGYYAPASASPTPTGDNYAPTATQQQEGEEIRGFELGFNIAGSNNIYIARQGSNQAAEGWVWEKGNSSKVAFQPGWNFGRFGIYLLLGFDFRKEQEIGETRDNRLDDFGDPGAGITAADGWAEKATIDVSVFTFDIGLAGRIYLLESLRAMSTNLFLELGLGWRGAAVKAELDWKYGGSLNGFFDGATTGDINSQQYENNARWNKQAQDYVDAAGERYDGLWANLGIGGEYVFTGGFGVAADVGLHLFYNNEWMDESPYGYDDDGGIGYVDWEHYGVKWTGTSIEFGLYYSVALRYHF